MYLSGTISLDNSTISLSSPKAQTWTDSPFFPTENTRLKPTFSLLLILGPADSNIWPKKALLLFLPIWSTLMGSTGSSFLLDSLSRNLDGHINCFLKMLEKESVI